MAVFFVMFLLMVNSVPLCGVSLATDEQSAKKIIKQSHLAGSWYPGDPQALSSQIDHDITLSRTLFDAHIPEPQVRAFIVPHAGYRYSGLCAASCYQTLMNDKKPNQRIKRVIIIAPSHLTSFKGIALPTSTHYQTPLGIIAIDQAAMQKLANHPSCTINQEAHGHEHALEIHLPFIQKSIAHCVIVPLITGNISYPEYPELIKTLKELCDDSTLIVISSDFTHHGSSYDYALFSRDIADNIRNIDSLCIEGIMAKNINLFNRALNTTGSTVCGKDPIRLLLALTEHEPMSSWQAHLASYYTSAHKVLFDEKKISSLLDNPPDQDMENSVSYAGIIFTTPLQEKTLTPFERSSLIAASRRKLTSLFEQHRSPARLDPIRTENVCRPQGVFVTLNKKNGDLRGCIGRITSPQPLYQTVLDMSEASALHDTRFTPLTQDELNETTVEITILSEPHPIDDYTKIKLGRDGIILKKIDPTSKNVVAQALFLPQVPGQFGWTLEETLGHLAQKAGIGNNGWKEHCIFEVFQGTEIPEHP